MIGYVLPAYELLFYHSTRVFYVFSIKKKNLDIDFSFLFFNEVWLSILRKHSGRELKSNSWI